MEEEEWELEVLVQALDKSMAKVITWAKAKVRIKDQIKDLAQALVVQVQAWVNQA